MTRNRALWSAAVAAVGMFGLGCGCSPDTNEPNNLGAMQGEEQVVRIKEQAFTVWVADDDVERTRGLMHVDAATMAPLPDGTERGMLFVFPEDQSKSHGFWMHDTIIPLDIAFIRADGIIVTIRTMAPLDERSYYPDGPYRYALEVNANLFSRLGIRRGDRVEIPESLLKGPE